MIKLIQRMGQSLFLQLEKGFNAIFGPELNPLYQLGAILFFLFWIVFASGFYIYVYYRTGVEESYLSVEHLTRQWYLGGIMRSLHRYASDGMVLLVLVHMLRNFSMDRISGFRAFSWITGMVTLLLLFICGLNGYWLVWDQLAQFMAVATTELLDTLPIFPAPLVRNFLTQANIFDRFFTVLSFGHIGIPMFMMAVIMIHTQRVSGAKTLPSRQLAIGVGLSLLVLALVKPALSLGRADLGIVATHIKLDWFFMAPYPLMYAWTPANTMKLLGGVFVLLMLLPFLARTKRKSGEFQIATAPSTRSFSAQPGETVLEAALRNDVLLPHQCRDGACGTCKGTILQGTVDYGLYQKDALTEEEKKAGKALFCCAIPLSNIEIEYFENETLKKLKVKIMQGHVHKMVRASPDVMMLYLKLPQGSKLPFIAGQYLDILLDDGTRRSFSFANSPHDNEFIQLHIRLIPGGQYTTHVFTQMKEGDEIKFEAPLGSFFLREEGDKPIIFVAGATGFAPVKSMIENAFYNGTKRRMLLYWGVRARKDLYMADLPERWQKEHDNFTFIPVLSEPGPDDNWQGRTGFVHEAILQDHPDLSGFQVYACGSLQMVQVARPSFTAQGLPEEACFSDAFMASSPKAAQLAVEVQS